MNILIACETSGVVRDAFRKAGHNAMSCDLLPTEKPGFHYQGDVRDVLYWGWDMMIAHPDCTFLTCSAAWAFSDGPYHQKVKSGTLTGLARRIARDDAMAFVELLAAAPIPMIAIENPAVNFMNKTLDFKQYGFRSNFPTQVIHPHQFGHDASKQTGLALKGLADLAHTHTIQPRIVNGLPRWGNQTDTGQNRLPPGPSRWLDRARTYQGWADAMASQWGKISL